MQADSERRGYQDYLDFELEIGKGEGRIYPVTVIHSPAGEACETMHFPFDELQLENRLLALQNALLRSGGTRRQMLSPEEQTVLNFGRALFDALIMGEVRSRYDVSLREAVLQSKGLRLKLRIQSPELAALPWELIYDSRQAEYICLSTNTPVVRYLELPRPIQPLSVIPPLCVLGMIANPKDLSPLDVAREKQRLENAIRDLRDRGLIDLVWLEGQTWRKLQSAMRKEQWHVFHFIGHGGFDRNSDEGFVALADEGGQAHPMKASELAMLLDRPSLRLVLLNACEGARGSKLDIFSSTAAILVRKGIPAVLAMQYEITDRAAIEFARSFYEALADGIPVDAAVAEARKAIRFAIANTIEWGTPVLYMRSSDGVLYHVQPSREKPSVQLDVAPTFQIGPTCPYCGAQTVSGATFCGNCGYRLIAESQPSTPSLPPTPLSAQQPDLANGVCTNGHPQIRPNARFCYLCGTPCNVPFATLPPLPTINARYLVVGELGRGGLSSVVYKVQDLQTPGRMLALKEMGETELPAKDRSDIVKAFQREADLLKRLDHPHIVKVYDSFQEGEKHYMAMDLVQGRTLEKMMETSPGGFPEARVLPWAEQLCDTLEYLHNLNPPIIYRDVKPGCVMVEDSTGQIKLIDFGIAREYKYGKLKRDEICFGADGYAPPEQYGGKGRETSPASDVYALGATLYHLLTGDDPTNHPFKFDFWRVRRPPVSASKHVVDALTKALEMEMGKRFQSMAEFKVALTGRK